MKLNINNMNNNDEFDFFAPEGNKGTSDLNSNTELCEKILIVDDEDDIHKVTKMAMDDFLYEGNSIEILSAYSAKEAKKILKNNPDISLVLLDVIMETEKAGLDLVTYIRETLNNKNIRIVIRTGQPGILQENTIMDEYEINDYRSKIELTSDKLLSIVKTGIKTYSMMKKMEASLMESQAKYKSMYKKSPLPYQSLDMEGIIVDVNPAWLTTLGYKKEDVIGKWFGDLLAPDSLTSFEKNFSKFIKAGHINDVHFSLRKSNGEYIFIVLEGDIGHNSFGEKTQTYCLFKDITSQVEAEQALKKSEEKFRLLTENSIDVIWTMDKSLRFTYISPSIKKLSGYEPEDWIGNKLSSFITKDEFIKAGVIIIKAIKNYKTFKPVIIESNIKDINNNNIEVEIKGSVLKDKNGNFIGFQGTTRAIAERKKSEKIQNALYGISNAANTSDNLTKFIKQIQKELRQIIDTTNFYVALYNQHKDIFTLPYMSDEVKTTNWFPAKETLTKYILDSKKPQLLNKKAIKSLEKKGIVGESGPDCEIWLGVPLIIKKDVIGVLAVQSYEDEKAFNKSDLKMLEFVSTQISNSIFRKKSADDLLNQNEEYEILNRELNESLSYIREMNKELEKAKDKAEESDKLKSAFLANMSHEIRTPMNGIMGFTDLLANPHNTDEQKHKYIEIIRKSGNRMLNTINDLMDISMIEAGQMKVNISDVDINEQCRTIHHFFTPEAEKKGIQLVCVKELDVANTMVKTDLEKLYAIISNLTKNAIKYSHSGKIEIGCELKNQFIEIWVADTGIGIPLNRQKAIFDRFVQADIEDKGAYEGSGLGLSISKAYVEMLGGNIKLESSENNGSTFTFSIPYIKSNLQTIDSKIDIPNNKNSDEQGVNKIIIAEDEIIAFEYLKIVLKKLNFEIIHAHTGEESIEKCRTLSNVKLILMDIKMPGIDGYIATREIRKFDKNVIIIAQTAYAQKADQQKAKSVGCDDYISKPIDKDLLLDKINEQLSKSKETFL